MNREDRFCNRLRTIFESIFISLVCFGFAVTVCATTITGCGTGSVDKGGFQTAHADSGAVTSPLATALAKTVSPASVPAVLNAVEDAHMEYLNAYESYVKHLRENGPQTMETLHALVDYQKKYQTYQRILAASQLGSGAAPVSSDH
ncbi:MAG: hypothetical protein HQM09_23810 [Candidatus Riflebacteria bacterium]|nr:hypothetical protein [Candidatus Riflebacteria bacterium]